MKFNQKLIKQLAAGEIILHNKPRNPELVKAILKETFPKDVANPGGNQRFYFTPSPNGDYWSWENDICETNNGTIIPISEFLLPEPKFKVGDLVQYCDGFKEVFRIGTVKNADDGYWYHPEGSSTGYKESALDFAPPEVYKEPEFIIGQEYEFSDDNEEWHLGKLLAIVDHKDKYVVGYEDMVSGHTFIRPIQPKEVTIERWVNIPINKVYIPVGYRSEESAKDWAISQYGDAKCIQVKLTGTYTI